MKQVDITMVRVYLTEAEAHLDTLLQRLHEWEKVRGVTVFRGISGFGKSGKLHTASLMDISMDLPIVVEFFDAPDKIDKVLSDLRDQFEPEHVVTWQAKMTMQED
jgi:PII-like signaling protein